MKQLNVKKFIGSGTHYSIEKNSDGTNVEDMVENGLPRWFSGSKALSELKAEAKSKGYNILNITVANGGRPNPKIIVKEL